MADEAKKKEKEKKPSALKRNLQSERKRLKNRSYRASVLTSIRSLKKSLADKEANDVVQQKLGSIYSMMDKGVKKGIFKQGKAARTKSRLSSAISKAAP